MAEHDPEEDMSEESFQQLVHSFRLLAQVISPFLLLTTSRSHVELCVLY